MTSYKNYVYYRHKQNEVDKMKNFYVIRELVDRTDIIPFYLQYERAKAYFNQMKKSINHKYIKRLQLVTGDYVHGRSGKLLRGSTHEVMIEFVPCN